MSVKDDEARGRVDVLTNSLKRAATGIAVVARPSRKGGSIFASFSMPSGKVRTLDKAAFNAALQRGDSAIRARAKGEKSKMTSKA